MIELFDSNDSRAVRNKANILGFYDLVINQKKSEEFVARFISPAYVQHNPLIADGPVALGKFFGQITRERTRARVVELNSALPVLVDVAHPGIGAASRAYEAAFGAAPLLMRGLTGSVWR